MSREKRCFTLVRCPYAKHCQHAYGDLRNGQFQPQETGEHCHHYKPLERPWGFGKEDECND